MSANVIPTSKAMSDLGVIASYTKNFNDASTALAKLSMHCWTKQNDSDKTTFIG